MVRYYFISYSPCHRGNHRGSFPGLSPIYILQCTFSPGKFPRSFPDLYLTVYAHYRRREKDHHLRTKVSIPYLSELLSTRHEDLDTEVAFVGIFTCHSKCATLSFVAPNTSRTTRCFIACESCTFAKLPRSVEY